MTGCPMKVGRFIEDRSQGKTLQQRIETACAEYMQLETDPPNLALVHPLTCEAPTIVQVNGYKIEVRPSIMNRWITWIGIKRED